MAATTEGGRPQSRAAPPPTAEPQSWKPNGLATGSGGQAASQAGVKRKGPHPGIAEERQVRLAKEKRLREAPDPAAAMAEEEKMCIMRDKQMLLGMPIYEVYHVRNGGTWTDSFIDHMMEEEKEMLLHNGDDLSTHEMNVLLLNEAREQLRLAWSYWVRHWSCLLYTSDAADE